MTASWQFQKAPQLTFFQELELNYIAVDESKTEGITWCFEGHKSLTVTPIDEMGTLSERRQAYLRFEVLIVYEE